MFRLTLLCVSLAACGGSATAPEAPANGRSIEVLIAGAGYTPDRIEAAPGEALDLVFFREDNRNCGGEVVFPDLGKRVAVPVGEKVHVAINAPENGTLAFTCGMAMYEGSLVVSGS